MDVWFFTEREENKCRAEWKGGYRDSCCEEQVEMAWSCREENDSVKECMCCVEVEGPKETEEHLDGSDSERYDGCGPGKCRYLRPSCMEEDVLGDNR